MTTMKYNVIHSAESSANVDVYQVTNSVGSEDVNAAVYAILCYVGEEVLKRSTCYISGERTAAELAGTVGKYCFPIAPLSENENHLPLAPETHVRAGTWKCTFPTEDIFKMMAEWEGVMGLTAKQTYRFQCETKEDMLKGMELKAYKRSRAYHGKRISFADEEKRIAQKFEVIGKMAQDLGSEGMRKALSVLVAAKLFKGEPYNLPDIAREVMLRKFWSDYGGMGPMSYSNEDFRYAPEAWKQVDDEYVKTLAEYFRELLNGSPVPEWPKVGCYVQFKNQENITKKYQGKFYVGGIKASATWGHIEWLADLNTSRHRYERHRINRLEPWVEPEKPTKKAEKKKEAKVVVKQIAQPKQTKDATAPLSIADRLREALRARLAA